MPIEDKVAALNKEATAAKRAGDMAEAVRLLREAKRGGPKAMAEFLARKRQGS